MEPSLTAMVNMVCGMVVDKDIIVKDSDHLRQDVFVSSFSTKDRNPKEKAYIYVNFCSVQ